MALQNIGFFCWSFNVSEICRSHNVLSFLKHYTLLGADAKFRRAVFPPVFGSANTLPCHHVERILTYLTGPVVLRDAVAPCVLTAQSSVTSCFGLWEKCGRVAARLASSLPSLAGAWGGGGSNRDPEGRNCCGTSCTQLKHAWGGIHIRISNGQRLDLTEMINEVFTELINYVSLSPISWTSSGCILLLLLRWE